MAFNFPVFPWFQLFFSSQQTFNGKTINPLPVRKILKLLFAASWLQSAIMKNNDRIMDFKKRLGSNVILLIDLIHNKEQKENLESFSTHNIYEKDMFYFGQPVNNKFLCLFIVCH